MSVDPALIRAEAHRAIGSLIQRDATLLIERWIRRAAQEQPNARRGHHEVLLDHLPDFLDDLGRSLAEEKTPWPRLHAGGNPEAAAPGAAPELATVRHFWPAACHGEQRWQNGWSIDEVVRDFQILRLVIVEYLEEALDRPLHYRETMAIGLALDDAIGASVTMYGKSREEHQRQAEVERAELARKTQDQLRQQTEILREVDRRKSEFLATLGHELRNPLAALWNAVQVLQMQAPTAETLAQTRGIMQRQVQQLERLVDDLLDISRIAQDKIQLRREQVELSAVLTQAAQTSSPHLKARHHRFTVTGPDQPMWLDADAARLVQVIVNLLNNAAKYTPPGGAVTLSARLENGEAVIRVSDNGIGIAPELLPHVFELFTQADLATDRAQGGMGIGLALVRRLVELHGGRVAVTSGGIGQGSEFVVRLPCVTAVPSSTESQTPVASPPRVTPVRRRILVVDDNVDAAITFGMLLTEEGHEVHLAHDGLSALEKAQSWGPEVVLLDIGMPRMDGHEVARRLRAQPGMEDVLLIALTGYGQDADRRRSKESGFHAHLVKPVDLEALQALLVVGRKTPVSA